MSRAHQPDLKKYLDKRLRLKLNGNREDRKPSSQQAPTRFSTTTIYYLLSADDFGLSAVPEADMQWGMGLFAAGCAKYGLTINTKKMVTVHQPPPNGACSAPRIYVNGTQLRAVDNFVYLGGTLSYCTEIDDEVVRRISKASQAFGRLRNSAEIPAHAG
nr:unnamed protein product [Spirometra erinaceieuropaei]